MLITEYKQDMDMGMDMGHTYFIYLFIFISSFSGHRPVQRNVHQLFKDPEYWAGWGLNPRPPVRQTDALPTDLARPRSYILHTVKTWLGFATGSPVIKYASKSHEWASVFAI